MKVEVEDDAEAVARRGADWLTERARSAVAERGGFHLAVSGGSTPRRMFELWRTRDVPWDRVHLFQVDERVAAPGSPDRNLTALRASLGPVLPGDRLHALPVEEPDLGEAAQHYAALLERIVGAPPVLDVVHLGLGADGHTASLFPGDPVLEREDVDVAATAHAHGGWRRLTLTLPMLARARALLWVVTGPGKARALARLRAGDRSIPAGRVPSDRSVLLADRAAAAR